MIEDVREGMNYVNSKTGSIYAVHAIAKAAWDVEQLLVVYESFATGERWVRSLSEFKEKFDCI
jgi:hypothetical protein